MDCSSSARLKNLCATRYVAFGRAETSGNMFLGFVVFLEHLRVRRPHPLVKHVFLFFLVQTKASFPKRSWTPCGDIMVLVKISFRHGICLSKFLFGMRILHLQLPLSLADFIKNNFWATIGHYSSAIRQRLATFHTLLATIHPLFNHYWQLLLTIQWLFVEIVITSAFPDLLIFKSG